MTYFRLLRINNYVKNLFIFAPLFFGFQFNSVAIINTSITFILFCLMVSGVYIFNDIYDLESDRNHPTKKNRPLASETVSVKKGIFIGAILISISLLIMILFNLSLFYIFLSYLGINVLYNLFLKRIPVVDVVIISLGFIIRIYAGSFATDIPASYWLLLMTFILSMFLGISKRRSDFVLAEKNNVNTKNIEIFSLRLIDNILLFFSISICITYLFYTLNDKVIEHIGSSLIIISNVFVILGIYRYLRIIKKTNRVYKDPTFIVLNDWKLKVIITLWVVSFIIIRYI